MFTAIILMCSIADPTSCYTASSNIPHSTEQQCRNDIKAFIDDPLFKPAYLLFDDTDPHKIVAVRCIDWNQVEISLDKSS